MEVFTQELLGTNFEGQTEINLGASYPLPTENFQFTKVLRPQDADPRKAKKVRGCITVTFSFKPKKESADTKHHFGKTLMESLSKSYNDNLLHITDKVIYNFLRFHLEDEGLFRLPGNANRVKYLKMEIENGIDSCWDEELVHDVGSLYKMYFATLSESDTLLPSAMYTEFKGISTISEEDEKIQKSKSIINKLPEANQHVLLSLLSFLNIISQYSAINKMTPKNLAVCFAPTIIIPNNVSSDPAAVLYDSHLVTELLSFIIANVDKMFPKCPYEAFSPPEPPPEVQETEYAQAINLLTKKSYLVNKRSQFSKARSSSAPSITVEGQKVPPPVTTPGGSGPGNPLATSEKKTSTFKEKRKAVMRQSSLSAFAKKTRPRSESAKKPHEANKKNETITEEELPDHLLVVEEEEEKSTMEKEKDKEKEKKSPLKSHASDMLLPVPDSEPGGSQSHRGKKRTSTNTRRRSLRKTLVVKFDPFKPDNEDMFMIDENPKE
uniref:Rho-GAP domain-containing protein n=1 Tax=Arcella intermedia TaxID=1963864 RepID=A0A6B2L1X4_9EUKA